MSPAWIAAGLLAASMASVAAPLRLIADERSVASFGSARTVTQRLYFDGTPTETATVQETRARQPVVLDAGASTGRFDVTDGASLHTPQATLDGQAAQHSSFSATGLRFDGVADVLAAASNLSDDGGSFTELRTGIAGGGAESSARWTFALDAAQPMRLSMTRAPDDSSFSFRFTADNGFVWAPPLDGSDDGALHPFTQVLALGPGVYTLDARLWAGVGEIEGGTSGARATASFSLLADAVPEPPVTALVLAGLLVLGGARVRRCRRP